MKTIFLTVAMGLAGALAWGPLGVHGQGMPPEAQANIHTLFQVHAKITRSVENTKNGYVATTESDDPKAVAALRGHIRQMNARLESGLMVRRWDPAFAEYVAHYSDIRHHFSKTKKGVRMTVTGKTRDAIRVAQNHAAVISEFVKEGWKAHDRSHPAVVVATQTAGTSNECCFGGGKGPGCGRASKK
ncbi:MAG: hypothetical protein JNN07_08470 [Verrucomicrobiales bacterium]|nr:hypothetical protein [Verrucomicrobiales bacterium]